LISFHPVDSTAQLLRSFFFAFTLPLQRVSGKARAKSIHGNAAVCRLQNLREVQLLMFAMFEENLHDIMDFLMTCCSPRLERLFVQVNASCLLDSTFHDDLCC
jgi:hypothetical protein